MAGRIRRAPTLKRHKTTGHAYARLSGRQLWFGHFDDPETHARFAALKAAWEANGRVLPEGVAGDAAPALTVADLVALYLRHAEVYYRNGEGVQTQEVSGIRYSVKPLLELFARLPAAAFDLRSLKQVRERLVETGIARPTVNTRVGRVVRVFRWGAEEEHLPAEIYGALRTLTPLKKGRTVAPEGEGVDEVGWEAVEATLPHLSSVVRAMVLLQWHTGMRPGEVREFKTMHLDRSDAEVWFYTPSLHKTAHHGKKRAIAIGPRGQEVVGPLLNRVPRPDPERPLFSPKDAMEERYASARRRPRRLALRDSGGRWVAGTEGKGDVPLPSDSYSKDTYARAVTRASKAAGVTQWSPRQLRHTAATRIREQLGLDAAQAVLGHSSADTTQIYAKLARERAREVMKQLG